MRGSRGGRRGAVITMAVCALGACDAARAAEQPPIDTSAYSPAAPTVQAQSTLITVPKPVLVQQRLYDPRITAIEVSQDVSAYQHNGMLDDYPAYPSAGLPVNFNMSLQPINGGRSAPVPYKGVSLEAGRQTRVRVHIAQTGSRPVENVRVVLFGFNADTGAPLFPPALAGSGLADARATGTPLPQYADRFAPVLPGQDFYLPSSWTRAGNLRLFAAIAGVQDSRATPCTTKACQLDDTFTLNKIPFLGVPRVTIQPLQIVSDPSKRMTELQVHNLIDSGVRPWPGGRNVKYLPSVLMSVSTVQNAVKHCDNGYAGYIEVSPPCFDDIAFDETKNWYYDNKPGSIDIHRNPVVTPSYDVLIGLDVDEYGAGDGAKFGGITSGLGRMGTGDPKIIYTTLTHSNGAAETLAHEYGHALSRPHASAACGATGGQQGESWAPDQQGELQGIAQPLGFATSVGPTQFDVMSYCDKGPLASTVGVTGLITNGGWVSPANWQRTIGPFSSLPRNSDNTINPTLGVSAFGDGSAGDSAKARAATAPPHEVIVSGVLTATGLQAVTARVGAPPPAGLAGSRVTAQPLDASGVPLPGAEIPASLDPLHIHGEDGTVQFSVAMPEQAAALALRLDGALVDTVARSAHAPVLSDLVIRRRTDFVKVGFKKSDADGDPVTADVDVSVDGGSTWRTAVQGLSGVSVVLPVETFFAGGKALVRVRAQDGTHETTLVSDAFDAPAAPPTVQLLTDGAQRTTTSARLVLDARASDALGRPLHGKQVVWRIDGRQVATGLQVQLPPLRRGTRKLEIVATTRDGASATLRRQIRVTAGRPALLVARARGAAVGATAATVRVATIAPATLATTHGPRATDSHVRTYVVPVTRGKTGCAQRAAVLVLRDAGGRARFVVPVGIAGGDTLASDRLTASCLRKRGR